jgi:hypothetical protein
VIQKEGTKNSLWCVNPKRDFNICIHLLSRIALNNTLKKFSLESMPGKINQFRRAPNHQGIFEEKENSFIGTRLSDPVVTQMMKGLFSAGS